MFTTRGQTRAVRRGVYLFIYLHPEYLIKAPHIFTNEVKTDRWIFNYMFRRTERNMALCCTEKDTIGAVQADLHKKW